MGEGSISLLPRPAIGRRGMVAGLAAGATMAPALLLPGPAMAGIPASRRLAFDVTRNNKPIGAHVISFGPPGPNLEVAIQVDIVVRWAGLVLYRYSLRGSETWQNGTLTSARAETNDDGTSQTMRAIRRDGRLMVEGSNGPTYAAPEKSIISSHWNPAQLDAPMIDIQDGELLDLKIAPRGKDTITANGGQVEADQFSLSGKVALELWYDRQRIWSKLTATSWEGSVIEYRRT